MELHGVIPPAPRVAIVGSRTLSARVATAVEQLVAGTRLAGFAVVSGGAIGVDACAHRACLVAGVPTLAVLPLGPDRPYPAHHQPLFEAIAGANASGVLFHQPRGTRPARGMFASRNRAVVDHASHVIVADARARSGSLQTGRLALRRGKTLAVLTGSAGAGTLLEAGAHALGHPDTRDLKERVRRWLLGVHVERHLETWPEHLQPLRAHAMRHGGRIELRRMDVPERAISLLLEAELRALVAETSPGVYVLLPGGRGENTAGTVS